MVVKLSAPPDGVLGGDQANPGQPTISLDATGEVVKRLQRALRRTPDEGLHFDGVFGPLVETAVKELQRGVGLTADGIVGPVTWAALPDGGLVPTRAAVGLRA
jgi:peptidoglycan hydrolase-like protein with peptidoglycan-binding domain